jgi:large subunit ribosomal protein L3
VETGLTLLGFIGYKAGVTTVSMVEDHAGSPNFGKEIVSPVTVLDTPPAIVCAIRAYTRDSYGLKTLTEAWMKEPPKDIERLITPPKNPEPEKGLKVMEENQEKIAEFRLLVATQPRLTRVPKKKPELVEIKADGPSVKAQFEYIKPLLGKKISITDVFKEGQFIDVLSITKGKGIQGPVKRWGVKKLSHKGRKLKRGIGTLGGWSPSRVLYTVPRAGQMGYHQRTEYNKRILKIGTNGAEATPRGGFLRYGPIKGIYTIIKGSLPGSAKRLVRLRYPARPPKRVQEAPPKITEISLRSPQQ